MKIFLFLHHLYIKSTNCGINYFVMMDDNDSMIKCWFVNKLRYTNFDGKQ
jgi:hypothetical protein